MLPIQRRLNMLHYIPRHPRKVTAQELQIKLAEDGYRLNIRTLQRELQAMLGAGLFGLNVDERSKPFGWYIDLHWRKLNITMMDAPTALAFHALEKTGLRLLPVNAQESVQPYIDRAQQVLELNENEELRHWSKVVQPLVNQQAYCLKAVTPEISQTVEQALRQKVQFSCEMKRFVGGDWHWLKYQEVNPQMLVYSDATPTLVFTLGALHKKPYRQPLFNLRSLVLSENKANLSGEFDPYKIRFATRKRRHFEDVVLKAKIRINAAFIHQGVKFSDDQQISQLDNDHLLLTASVVDSDTLRHTLYAMAHSLVVLEPESIRRHIKKQLTAAINAYQ